MNKCNICNGIEFEVVSGSRVCLECGGHANNFIELEHEEDGCLGEVDTTKYKRMRILRQDIQSNKDVSKEIWTTFEAMNIILLNFTNALINIGASKKLRESVKNLWVIYLKKRKIAFCKKIYEDEKNLQFLNQEYLALRDMEIIRNISVLRKSAAKKNLIVPISEIEKVKRKLHHKKIKSASVTNMTGYLANELSRTLNSSYLQECSEDESSEEESIYERSHVNYDSSICEMDEDFEEEVILASAFTDKGIDKQEKDNKMEVNARSSRISFGESSKLSPWEIDNCPTYLTVEKLLSFLYLAMLQSEDNILLLDLLRWCREGHVPFFAAIYLLRPNISMSSKEYHIYFNKFLPSAHRLRLQAGTMATFLSIQALPLPSFENIINKFTRALCLPIEVASIAEKSAKLFFMKQYSLFKIPPIEVFCASCIILALKVNYGLDDQQEHLLSEFADKVNRIMEKEGRAFKLFSWSKWQSYINRLSWWLKEVDVALRPPSNEILNVDMERFSQYFWTKGIWKNLYNEDDIWQNRLAEYLLDMENRSLGKLMKNDPLFRPYLIPFKGQLETYIAESFKRDPSLHRNKFLKIAKELNKVDFAKHRTCWIREPDELKFELGDLAKNIDLHFVSFNDRRRIFRTTNLEKKSFNKAKVILLPDPLLTFWVLKVDGFNSDAIPSNFIWLVKQFSSLCETTERDILEVYAAIEDKYLGQSEFLKQYNE